MTAIYLLDTDTCIYLKNHRPPSFAKRFSQLKQGEVVMSLITYGELYNGAMKSREADAALANLERLSKLLPVVTLPVHAGSIYGQIRSRLEQKGTIIGGNDLWIAAHAISLDLILVTNNTRKFIRVEGLKFENWI